MSVFSLDFSRILKKAPNSQKVMFVECILVPPSLSNLQTFRFDMKILITRYNHHQCQVVHHLSTLGQERFPIEAAEESQLSS